MVEQLCSEQDSNLEKIIQLEKELINRGFHYIDTIKESSLPPALLIQDCYECFVLVPKVDMLKESVSEYFKRKYVISRGVSKLYALKK